MHRIASLGLIAATAYLLIATSAERCKSTAESVPVTSSGTCGPDTAVTVTQDESCGLTVLGGFDAGLPTSGTGASTSRVGVSLVATSGSLSGPLDAEAPADGGTQRSATCTLTPNDAGTGWDVLCDRVNCAEPDAGCEDTCTGTLQ